jgi:hypothetical protein
MNLTLVLSAVVLIAVILALCGIVPVQAALIVAAVLNGVLLIAAAMGKGTP